MVRRSIRHISVIVTFLCVFIFMAANSQAQTRFTPEKIKAIDAMIIAQMSPAQIPRVHIPGLTYTLIENGEIVHTKGFGSADSAGTPVTANTTFNIGSLTKSFTAMSIVKASDRDILNLDMPVTIYLPDFRTKDKTVSDRITVRHLLNHTSGFSTYAGNLDHLNTYNGTDALLLASAKLKSAKLHAAPGEVFQYSNANYQILGAILEQVWGMPYADIINQQIFEPLSLADSFVRSPSARQKSAHIHIAQPHRIWFNHARVYNWNVSRETVAQGGIYASAPNLAQYLIEYMRPVSHENSPSLLSKTNIADMTSLRNDEDSGYGLGWEIRKNFNGKPGHTYIYHSGLAPGYSALAGFIPEEKIGFVILTNASSGYISGNVAAIKFGLADFILDKPQTRTLTTAKTNLVLLIAIFSVPALIVIWTLLFARKYKRGRPEKRVSIVRTLTPTALLLGTAWAFAVVIPKANNASLATVRLFNPDIGLALMLGALTCTLWAIVRFGLLVMRK